MGRVALLTVATVLLMAAGQAPAQPGAAEPGGMVADVLTCLVKPKQVVQLGSPVFGALAKVMVDRAERVSAGQVVAKLDTAIEEEQLALDRFRASNTTEVEAAKVDLTWNERELTRRQQLAGNLFSKANDIDELLTKVEQDRIAIRKAENDLKLAQLEMARTLAQYNQKLIRSPLNGMVSEIKLAPGEFIYEQTPIMTLVQFDPLTIDLVFAAERYHAVRVGTTAKVYLSPPVDRTVDAKVDAIDPVIDPASDTFRVRLALANPDNAIPAGVRCSARLPDQHDE